MPLNNVFLDDLVKRITDERADVFGVFYAPYLADCAQRIAGLGRGVPLPKGVADLAGVAESALRTVADACAATGMRTLIASLQSEGIGYETFCARVGDEPGRSAVLGRFPELDRLLKLHVDRTVRTVDEVLRAATTDRRHLDVLLGGPSRITSLTPGLGDAHRGGRTVSLVVREDGTRAIHKPQQDNCQQLLAALHASLDPEGTFFGPLSPRSLVRPTHVWQEFVEHTDLDGTDQQSIRYFRRFGRASALLSMIGATDLHHENIIATQAGPVVIDTETLVSLPGSTREISDSAISHLNRDIEQSVLNTVLFPTRYLGAKLDVDISGVGSARPGVSANLQTFQLVGAGTDSIRFDRLPSVVTHGTNMATVAGEPLDPREWTDEIVAGFREARQLLAAHRQQVEDVVVESRGWAVRQVVRPTYVYARFLEASIHPVHLGSRQDRVELLSRLPMHYRGASEASAHALHREEVSALVDLDIPFFTVDSDATRIRGGLDHDIQSAAGVSPRQSALAAVDSFFSRPPERDPMYIRYALACAAEDAWESRRAQTTSRRTTFPDLADSAAWHSVLGSLVVGTDSESTWLSPQLQGDGLRLGPTDTTLFGGGGLLLHLAATEERTGGGLLGADLERACASVLSAEPVMDGTASSLSPFTGSLSAWVTDWEVRRLHAPSARFKTTLPRQGATPAPDVAGLDTKDFDYLNGYGGYLVYLATYHRHGAPEVAGIPAEQLLQRLVAVDGDPAAHPAGGELGLAHGRFGRITAMSALVGSGILDGAGAHEHLEQFAQSYARHRWTDEVLRDPVRSGSWCKGYAGVTYAAATLLTALGESNSRIRDEIAPEVERILSPGAGPDISLCHGLAGRIIVLCHLADRLEWSELRSGAAALHRAFLERYAEGGWKCGVGTEPYLPSFFLGLSGWFMAQSILDNPGAALPLCLGGR